jgi:two-component system, NarL family, nitrate/nitrite response regulator NarL
MSDSVPGQLRLLLIDDHALFREALAERLNKEPDISVIGFCGSMSEALHLIRAGAQPNMILLDFDLGSERTVDFVPAAREAGFAGQVLIVTAGLGGRQALQLIQSGVRGILHKHNTPGTLCDIIRRIAQGEAFLEPVYMSSVFQTMDRTKMSGGPRLTGRDKDILRLLFQGLANKEIAARLQVSEGAIKSSVSQLFQKLSVHTRAQLVKVALEQYADQL